jgi:hypothetical protein
MHVFVARYQAMLDSMAAEESKDKHVTKQV